MKAKIVRNRKGISPIFVTVYLAILVLVLLSMLFTALHTYGSSLTERMKVEEERRQESIGLIGPEALNFTEGTLASFLRVNNTGSITVRIRALYVGQKFICDPSKFTGDAYINPKETLWIQLYPNVRIELNSTTLNAYWTVTTERGTKSSEIGAKLIWGEPWVPGSPKKFYIGPLMLMFDMFHWRSGTGPWRNGWTIPTGTDRVTWRILVVNIDDRDIIISEKSCFTLISNEPPPADPLTWYIDPMLGTLTFKPGVFNFVYYTWSKPITEGGASRQSITFPFTTCINFLTFFGSFLEPNGTLTSYGQTIPFEAVLVTTESMASSLIMTSNPENIRNDGFSTSTITATVTDSRGRPVPDAWVDFYTTAGTLSATRRTTDANGVATVTLTSSTSPATAYITAICQSVEGTSKVNFTPATGIRVSANPTSIPRNGGTSIITVQLIDANDANVAQAGITITVRLSGISGGRRPTLTYGDQSGDSVTVTTDSRGQALITLTARGASGTATITASASGLTSGSTTVTVT